MHQNASVAQGDHRVVLPLRRSAPQDRAVDLEFPTNIYLFEGFRRYGAEIVSFRGEDGIRTDLERLLDAIDERTLLVPLSLVLFRSSYIQDARAVIEKAHRVGAHVILDIYQAAGVIPVDLQALGADFAVGGSVKWLCGGPGAGYLYVRPDLAPALEPAFVGWAAHAEPFEFEAAPIRYAPMRPSASRAARPTCRRSMPRAPATRSEHASDGGFPGQHAQTTIRSAQGS